MRRLVVPFALVAIAACSSLPDAGNGVVALQILAPDSLVLVVDSGSVTLHATALDIHGDSVPAQVFWRTPDTAFVTLDSVSGIMAGKNVGQAHVQARTGTLLSDVILFTVRPPDTTAVAGIRRRP